MPVAGAGGAFIEVGTLRAATTDQLLLHELSEDEFLARIRQALDCIRWHLEFGWDEQYGGIRYITNVDWTPCHSLEADMKLWWPHGETL